MTIKELYEWSLKHNSEDYELFVVDELFVFEVLAKEVTSIDKDDLEINQEGKQVIIAI
jgi:hypothetical protein